MTKKSTKKSTKPAFIVNMDDITSLEDVAVVFALAKQDAGLPISDYDLISIIDYVADHCAPKITFVDCSCCKIKCHKLPWYKRFWNWLLRK